MRKILLGLMFSVIGSFLSAEVLVYGPGGPAPVLKELAGMFNKQSGKQITIIAGPTSAWMKDAKINADIIYSGSSTMMDTFSNILGKINNKNIVVLNIREAGILVRKNNPKNIKNFKDILKSGTKVMVVDGAGQVGLYEDMALKSGKRNELIELRKNIAIYAKNSKEAVDTWKSDSTIDALIIWKHWQKVLKNDADFIKAGKSNSIYRAAEIAIVDDSKNKEIAQNFINFIQSKEVQKIWVKHGWISNFKKEKKSSTADKSAKTK